MVSTKWCTVGTKGPELSHFPYDGTEGSQAGGN